MASAKLPKPLLRQRRDGEIRSISDGAWSSADVDVVVQLFGAWVWDGDLASKDSRDYLVDAGHAVRTKGGGQTLTLNGISAALSSLPLLNALRRRSRSVTRGPMLEAELKLLVLLETHSSARSE